MEKHLFKEYNLQPWIHEVTEKLRFKHPTPIQTKVIPAVLQNRSVIGQSETGSGKTHAFLLPLFSQLRLDKKEVQFVIITPTRELSNQIFIEVQKMMSYMDDQKQVTAKLFIGGTDKKRMIDKISEQPQIIIATPGRLLDIMKEGAIDLYTARTFVLDEADLMVDLGLMNEIDQILVRANPDIQGLVFSATIPERLQPFLKKYLHNPLHFHLSDHVSPDQIENRLVPLRHREPSEVIARIAKVINPYIAIIFANGKDACNALHKELHNQGLNVGLIHGGLTPRERKRVVKEIQALKYQYVVATDLAARGIDIDGVSHVINAELPKEVEFFTHRIGRTARAGMDGTAIHLYKEEDALLLNKLIEEGVEFKTYDIIKDNWKEIKDWNARKTRKREDNDLDREAWRRVRKPKKVKPGYKKKMKRQQEQIKKQLQKERRK